MKLPGEPLKMREGNVNEVERKTFVSGGIIKSLAVNL